MTPDQARARPLGEVANWVAECVVGLERDSSGDWARPDDKWWPDYNDPAFCHSALALRALGVLEQQGWELWEAAAMVDGTFGVMLHHPDLEAVEVQVVGPASTHFPEALFRACALAQLAEIGDGDV